MDEAPRQPSQVSPQVPVSVFHAPIDQLLRCGALKGANRPGMLGSADRFEVVRVLGTGGMGVVVLARDPMRDEEVAIKFLRPELCPSADLKRRFLAEATHMERLAHPGIVPVLEIFENGGTPGFVMPFMHQGSLARELGEGGPLTTERALQVTLSVAEALAHAHAKGVIHRDLKPDNVLSNRAGGVYLTDFGLARTLFNETFIDVDGGQCEGTAPYMSPAVASGEAEDTRCDIYGLGALLYEMLTGTPPYQGADSREVVEKIKAGPPLPIFRVNPKADAALTSVAEAAMARELRHRYAQMRDVVKDLRRIKAGLAPMGPRGYHRAVALRDAFSRVPQAALWPLATAFVLCVFLGVIWHFGGRHLEVTSTVSVPQVAVWSAAELVQWDGVGGRELAVLRERDFVIVGSRGEVIGTFGSISPPAVSLRLGMVKDLNGDGLEEVFASWADDSLAHLAAINRNDFHLHSWSVKRTEFVRNHWGRDATNLRAERIVDLDGDGKEEILVSVISDHSQPRGLYCFDMVDGTLRWAHKLAGFASVIEVADLDGDGTLEIIIGTQAPANSEPPPVDGTDNHHSYLLAITSGGELRWRREIADYYTTVRPVVFTGADGRPRLYSWVTAVSELRAQNHHPNPRVGTITAWGGQGEVLASHDVGNDLESCVARPAGTDGRRGILATDHAGYLHEFTADLALVSSRQLVPRQYSVARLRIVGAMRASLRLPPYLVLECVEKQRFGDALAGENPGEFEKSQWRNRCAIVLDEELQEIARFTEPGPYSGLSWRISIADLDGDQTEEILWLDDRFRVLRLKPGR